MTEPELAAWAEPTAVVRALPFMAHLPAEVRNLVLSGFEERTYHFGETVFAPEDGAFVVVVEGEVRVIAEGAGPAREVSLGVLGPGQMSGERALVEEHAARGHAARRLECRARAAARPRRRGRPRARAPRGRRGLREQAHAKRIAAFLRTDETFRDLDARGVELIVGARSRRRGPRRRRCRA